MGHSFLSFLPQVRPRGPPLKGLGDHNPYGFGAIFVRKANWIGLLGVLRGVESADGYRDGEAREGLEQCTMVSLSLAI